ncbi:hypothetical protein CFP65_7309 [Kitasatospora sp. MMS16-BH015]|nr:hypothetical protein CFP65_7309 [Kitasatospora sp. MMS16-BH015]
MWEARQCAVRGRSTAARLTPGSSGPGGSAVTGAATGLAAAGRAAAARPGGSPPERWLGAPGWSAESDRVAGDRHLGLRQRLGGRALGHAAVADLELAAVARGQLIVPSATSWTAQPRWVQSAENALNWPGTGCVTTTFCSLRTTPPPTGTSAALSRGAPPPAGDWLAAGESLAVGAGLAEAGGVPPPAADAESSAAGAFAADDPPPLEQATRATARPVPPAIATAARREGCPVELEPSATGCSCSVQSAGATGPWSTGERGARVLPVVRASAALCSMRRKECER